MRIVADPVLDYFEAKAPTYLQAAQHGFWGWQRRREAEAVTALAGSVAGRSALDLGCGTGFYARLFVERGAGPVTAVDGSSRMVVQAQAPGITAITGDVATVDLGRSFDLVVAAGVLEFVADSSAVLANARRHLAPGGRVVILVPPTNPAGWLYRLFHSSHGVRIRLFSRAEIAGLAARSGLRPTGSRLVFPYSLIQVLEAV